MPPDKAQIDKFRNAARELETDSSEENFDSVLRKIADSRPPLNPKPPAKTEAQKK